MDSRDRETSLRDTLQILWRRRWSLLAVVVVVPAAAVASSLTQPARYQASAQVLLTSQVLAEALTNLPGTGTDGDTPDRLASTQAQLAKNPTVARRTLAQLGLPASLAGELLAATTVTTSTDSNLLLFAVQDHDQARATALVNAYARQYTRFRSQIDTAPIARARSYVRRQIRDLRTSGQRGSTLYRQMVNKDTQLQTLQALQTGSSMLVRPAQGAAQIAPRPLRNGLLALLVGVVLAIGVAFLREALDTRVRNPDEIVGALGMTPLATLPPPPQRRRPRRGAAEPAAPIVLQQPGGAYAESLRLLRTKLDFANLGPQASAIMVSSAVAGEGKSTTIANLAVTYARAGRRVVLIDLDLRRPKLHTLFDVGAGPGVTGVIADPARLQEALVPIPLAAHGDGGNEPRGSLRVLPAGRLPPDPGEFVGQPQIRQLIDALRPQADLVLVDGTPLLTVGDALTASTAVDAILLLARLNLVKRRMLVDLTQALERTTTPTLGLVVVGTLPTASYAYYGYGGTYLTPNGHNGDVAEDAVAGVGTD